MYLNTWHGTPLKKLALDMDQMDMAGNQNIERYHENFRIACRDWDYLVSQNKFSTEVFKSCFDFADKPILEIGYPRNDVLFQKNNEKDIRELKEKLGLPLDKKIMLYAPTWRDDQYVAKGYTFHLEADFRKWKRLLGEDHVVVFKPHYLIINEQADDPQLEGFLYSIGADQDISSLYLIADVLVTDYSSVFYDYSVLKRPIYFYMYDIESYREELRILYE